ncbi:hypothetical protein FD06_GL000162 [Apilactobacillus ozensis DSM 23829 = JCM 17196]|uniref:VWA-like domain-containing protein n=1 Tax=Apilactobacillus ozensis DSM 23829 = JCM 17196 TaxID=1423781 RepID=A0A0R2AYX4_9LACO|nr:VWA-like domain-containing protein [Apilactobacillus ozensis]KRM68044.1 hypothetical protein FD06_GL000162 [Apilactobacillus ozensis DSM 23829 = JCM 17196]
MIKINLNQEIFNLRSRKYSEVPNSRVLEIINYGIINMLNTNDSFYGNILIKINKLCNPDIKSPLALTWQQNDLMLAFNPKTFISYVTSDGELYFMLKHLAMHIAWLHPIRYSSDNKIVNVACDIAINQYLDKLPSDAISVDKLNFKYDLHLPHFADSSRYISLLMQNDYFKSAGNSNSQQDSSNSINDDHEGWKHNHNEDILKTSIIKKIVKDAMSDTSIKNRGVINNNLKLFIDRFYTDNDRDIDWKSFLQLGSGNINFSNQNSYSRFDRRQPYRMDLPGKISNYVKKINIFIDNSGSMTSYEVSFLLQQLQKFLKKYHFPVYVYPFDTKVHVDSAYKLNNYNDVKFEKIGSGGTTFQSIFDFLHLYNKNDDISVVLTDGKGEPKVNQYNCYNTFWVITGHLDEFSLNEKIIAKTISINKK